MKCERDADPTDFSTISPEVIAEKEVEKRQNVRATAAAQTKCSRMGQQIERVVVVFSNNPALERIG